MAKVKYVAPVGALSGAVGKDYVGYGFGGRNFSRQYVVPVNNDTPDTIAQRVSFANISQAFKALSVSQVEAWKALGQLIIRRDSQGSLYKLTASQAFSLINNYLAQMGEELVDDPPGWAPPVAAFTNCQADVVIGTGVMTVKIITPAGYAGGQKVLVEATRELGSGTRNARETDFRKMNTGVTGSLVTLAAGTETDFTPASPAFLYNDQPNWVGIRLTPVSGEGVPGVPVVFSSKAINFAQ